MTSSQPQLVTMTTETIALTYLQEESPELVIASHTTARRVTLREEGSHVFHVLTQLATDLLQNHLQVALGKLSVKMEFFKYVHSQCKRGVLDRCSVNTQKKIY